tara:strand:+ start:536954 stop:538081 length:1128 start_codon:yes stop_codon:yes gene_type:complete
MPKLPENQPAAASRPPDLGIDLPQRTTPALLFSVLLHVLLLLAIGLFYSSTPSGTGGTADRPAGIALVHRMPDRDRYQDAKESTAATEAEAAASQIDSSAAASAAPPADLSPPIDLAGLLQAMEATPSPQSGTGLAGETSLTGDAFGSQAGKRSAASSDQSTAMMFGISGSGSEFVYVMDRSDSMNGFNGRPLRAAKAELLRSLRSLSEHQRFQIIFYNDKPSPFRPSGMGFQMVPGESSIVTVAEQYVKSITAFGGTEHQSALHLALRMAPDVIFFLTDASIPRLSASELAEIQRRALRSGTTIHAIEFGTDAVAPRGSFLNDLAAQNNGSYQYVDVQKLLSPASVIDATGASYDAHAGDGAGTRDRSNSAGQQ